MKGIWEVLGIEETTDKKIIRKAYSELVKQYHPEEQPEKYKQIREAYEQALFYVRYSSESHEEDQDVIFVQQQAFVSENISYEKQKDELEDSFVDGEMKELIRNGMSNEKQEDEVEDSFVDREMKELIRNGMSSIVLMATSVYETNPNDLEAWKQCFNDFKDHEELILETIFNTTMELITNEIVIEYFQDVVESLPRKDIDIYNKRLRDLHQQLEQIKKGIFGHRFFSFLNFFSTVLMIITIPMSIIAIAWIGYKAIFQDNQSTIDYLFFVFLSIWCTYRLYHIFMRNVSRNKHFFYRDFKLIGIKYLLVCYH